MRSFLNFKYNFNYFNFVSELSGPSKDAKGILYQIRTHRAPVAVNNTIAASFAKAYAPESSAAEAYRIQIYENLVLGGKGAIDSDAYIYKLVCMSLSLSMEREDFGFGYGAF